MPSVFPFSGRFVADASFEGLGFRVWGLGYRVYMRQHPHPPPPPMVIRPPHPPCGSWWLPPPPPRGSWSVVHKFRV